MSTKGRIKFVVAGQHPLMQLVRDRLIHTGYALVPWSERPDFCLFGAQLPPEADVLVELPALTQQAQAICGAGIPTVLLSSGRVYGDHEGPVSENAAQSLASPLDPAAGRKLYTCTAEHLFLKNTRTLALRIFNVYGPDIRWGVVHEFIMAARRGEALPLHGSGYQKRSFLYQDDLFECLDSAIHKFATTATRGIYNVGHPDGHSIKRLADSVSQLTQGKDAVTLTTKVKASEHHVPNKVPNITRVKAFAGWKPRTSLRLGLRLLLEGA